MSAAVSVVRIGLGLLVTLTVVTGRGLYTPPNMALQTGGNLLTRMSVARSAQAFTDHEILGGEPRPGFDGGPIDCISECLAEKGECVGVDYEISPRTLCVMHYRVTECSGQFVYRKGVTHYRLTDDCSSSSDTGSNSNYDQQWIQQPSSGVSAGRQTFDGSNYGLLSSNQYNNQPQYLPDVSVGRTAYQNQYPSDLLPSVASNQPRPSLPEQYYPSIPITTGLNNNNNNNNNNLFQYSGEQTAGGTVLGSRLNIAGPRSNTLGGSGGFLNALLPTGSSDIFSDQQQDEVNIVTSVISGFVPDNQDTDDASFTSVSNAAANTASNSQVPPGFVSKTRRSHLIGGYRLLIGTTEQQCLDACMMTSYCLAVDYDVRQRACFVHGTSSYCGGLFTQSSVNHYQRVPCVYGTNNGVTEVRVGYLVSGGQEACTGCRLEVCMTQCFSLPQCLGLDYDRTASRCYLHGVSTICGSYTPSSYVTHISTIQCAGSSLSLPQFSQTSDYGNINYFNLVRFTGPTRLPAGWLAYPGYRVSGGTRLGFNVSGDYCASLCALNQSCYSFDYNTRDGSCWVETTPQLKCTPLVPTNDVYHAKKPPHCATTTGSYWPYPYPLTIAV